MVAKAAAGPVVEAVLPRFRYLGSAIGGDKRKWHAVEVEEGIRARRTLCGLLTGELEPRGVHPTLWSEASTWEKCKRCRAALEKRHGD